MNVKMERIWKEAISGYMNAYTRICVFRLICSEIF